MSVPVVLTKGKIPPRGSERILPCITQSFWVNVIAIGIQRDQLPLDGVEHQLVEESVVGSDEPRDVILRHRYIHLEILPNFLDNLTMDINILHVKLKRKECADPTSDTGAWEASQLL